MKATEDVGTTPRKALTATQRLKQFEKHKGVCSLCGNKIVGDFIDEHMLALALGGGNELANRGIAHPKCAAVKTKADMERITKAKAQKKKQHGMKPQPAKKIESPGFAPTAKTKTASRHPELPRWSLFK